MPQLTAADAAQAAGLILRCMPREHAAIVHAMSSQPELQFKYLKVRQFGAIWGQHGGNHFVLDTINPCGHTHSCWLLIRQVQYVCLGDMYDVQSRSNRWFCCRGRWR